MTRTDRATALLSLLRRSNVPATSAAELRTDSTGIPPGMIYALRGVLYHLPHREGRGYIASLRPGTPEAAAYIGQSTRVEIPEIHHTAPGYHAVRRLWEALEK